jgi:phenylalanine-4-hydroxylase
MSFKDKLSIAHLIFASSVIFFSVFGERWMDEVHFSCIGVNGPISDISLIRILQKTRFPIAMLYSNHHFMLFIERDGQALGLDGLGHAALLGNIAKQAFALFDLGDIPLPLLERAWV